MIEGDTGKTILERLAERYEPTYDAVKLSSDIFKQLVKEVYPDRKLSDGICWNLDIEIKGHRVYVVGGNGKDYFYKMGSQKIKPKPVFPLPEGYKENKMEQVAITKEVSAVAFQSSMKKFTNGQMALLHLFNEKMVSKEPVTLQDCRELYARYLRNRPVTVHGYVDGVFKSIQCENGLEAIKVKPTYYDYDLQNWLKQNIGALVMKGALVAIPVMQLGEDGLKGLE